MIERKKDINQGDLLTFRASDGMYKAIFCTSTFKKKSPHNFTFAATTYNSEERPTVDKIIESEFVGIGNRKSDYLRYTDAELEKIWIVHPEVKPYFLGSYGILIYRKEFMSFRDNLDLISNIPIINNLDKHGSGCFFPGEWNLLNDFFTKEFAKNIESKSQKTFKVKAVIQEIH